MKIQFPFLFHCICAAAALSFSQTLQAQDPCAPPTGTTIVRTMAYHQITALPQDTAMTQPVMSGNGNKIAFTDAPGSGNDTTPNRIYTINPDGTGMVQVDVYKSLCFCNSYVDISDDGTKVVSTDAVQVRIADGSGGGAKSLLVLNSNEIDGLRISGDGSKVYFKIGRNAGYLGPEGNSPSTPIERGVWVINADGTGLRQVVSPAQFAAVIGVPVEQVPVFQSGVGSLFARMDVSYDGSKIVFSNFVRGLEGWARYDAFAVNLDGTGLHALLQSNPVYLWNVAIDHTGTKVAVSYSPFGRHSDINDIEVMNFDGTGRKLLRTHTNRDTMQLSSDGSKLLIGGADPTYGGLLIDTVTGEQVSLAQITPGSGGHTTVLYSGMVNATMNGAANRFAYKMSYIRCADCANQPVQLAVADLNPTSLGAAPAISEAKVDPPYVLAGRLDGSRATASARVTTENAIQAVGVTFFRQGLYDINMRDGDVLFDNATNGDVVAGDKLYTTHWIQHSYVTIRDGDMEKDIGPRTVRVSAEVRSGDGRLHATAVDFTPFSVLKVAPVPTVSEIFTKKVRRGTAMDTVIEGTFFSGTPTVAFLLNGQPDPTITVSNLTVVHSGRLRLTLNVPSSAPLGDRVVQITAQGGVSTAEKLPANTFTIDEIDVNGDDTLNVIDAIAVLRRAVGLN